MLTLTDAKNYVRATDEDDVLVQSLIDASKSYLAGAVDDFESRYEQAGADWQAKAELAQKLLVADWYENRTPEGRPANSAVELLIAQLQLEGA